MVEKPEHVIDFQIHVNVFFHPAVAYICTYNINYNAKRIASGIF